MLDAGLASGHVVRADAAHTPPDRPAGQGRLWRFASTLIENDIRMRSFVEGGRRADGEDGAVRIWTGARGIAGTGVSATTLRGGGRNNGSALPATAVPVDR